jgi:hypothetical protein
MDDFEWDGRRDDRIRDETILREAIFREREREIVKWKCD